MQSVRCEQGHTWKASGQETVALCPVCGGSPTVWDDSPAAGANSDQTIGEDPSARPRSQDETAYQVDNVADESVRTVDIETGKSAIRMDESTLHLSKEAAPSDQTVGFVEGAGSRHAAGQNNDATVGLDEKQQPAGDDRTIDLPREATRQAPKGDSTDELSPSQIEGTLPLEKAPPSAKPTLKSRKKADPLGGKTVVAGYQILGELGRGGMGVVYKARQPGANRIVALKMVLNAAHAGPESLMRFKIEAESIALLQHPNIVQLYDVGEEDGCPFFSLEFVEGESLAKKIENMPQPAEVSARMVQHLADAMYTAHQRGIIHRDLKPANVLLTKDGVPKITDFGLAKRFENKDDGQTRTGAIMGTPSYMAPEQAEGRTKDTGPPADIYSLGAILYDMVTGRPPFRGSTLMETLQQVKTLEPVAPKRLQPSLPHDLQTICLKTLEKDPAKRYATAGALAEDLRRFLSGEPILARPTAWYERSWKWIKRKPAVASLVGVCILAVVTFLAIGGFWLDSERRNAEALAAAETTRATQEKAAREKEESLRKIADRNFKRAKAAVDEMLSAVGQDRLRNIPQMEPVRRELLTKAKAFYDEFMQEQNSDPNIRLEAALAQQRVADILEKLGDSATAIKAYESALGLLQKLEQEFPERTDVKKSYANTANNYGNLLQSLKRYSDAEQNYRLALNLREFLRAKDPQNVELSLEVAKSHNNWAQVLRIQGNGKGAELEFQAARMILEGLPPQTVSQAELGRTLNNLGTLQKSLNNTSAAEATLGLANTVLRDLVAKVADDPGPRQDLAQNFFLQARLFRDTDAKRAEADYHQAIELQDTLAKNFLYTPAYKQELADSYSDLAILLQSAGRQKEADEAYEHALDSQRRIVKDFAHLPDYRFNLGVSLNNRAIMLLSANRAKDAETAFVEAMNIFSKLKDENPDVAQYAMEYADTCQNLGAVWQPAQPKKALDVVRQAMRMWEELTQKNTGSAEFREKLARAQTNVGRMLLYQQPKEAKELFVLASGTFTKLVSEDGTNRDYRHQLASAHDNLAKALRTLEQPKEAEAEWRVAIGLFADLARDFPDVPGYAQEIGKLYNDLGIFLAGANRPADAKKAWEDAVAVRQKLVETSKGQPEYCIELARSHGNLGILYAQTQDFARAEKQYRVEIALLDEMDPKLLSGPTLQTHTTESIKTHQNLANLMVALQKPAEAEKSWLRMVELREKLVQAFPTTPEFRLAAVANLNDLGVRLLQAQKFSQAKTYYDKADEHLRVLTKGASVSPVLWNNLYVIQYKRALCLVGLKDYEAAYQVVHNLPPQAKDRQDHQVAALMARCAGLADKDSPEATKYADEALALLRQAVAGGFRDVAFLNDTDDFEVLRARADFQNIVSELRAQKK